MVYRNRWNEFIELMEATALTVAVVASGVLRNDVRFFHKCMKG